MTGDRVPRRCAAGAGKPTSCDETGIALTGTAERVQATTPASVSIRCTMVGLHPPPRARYRPGLRDATYQPTQAVGVPSRHYWCRDFVTGHPHHARYTLPTRLPAGVATTAPEVPVRNKGERVLTWNAFRWKESRAGGDGGVVGREVYGAGGMLCWRRTR